MKKTEAQKQNCHLPQAKYRLLTRNFKMCTFILILHTGTHKHSVLFICYLTISIYIQTNKQLKSIPIEYADFSLSLFFF